MFPIALFVGRRTPPPAFALIAVSGPRLIVDPARLISKAKILLNCRVGLPKSTEVYWLLATFVGSCKWAILSLVISVFVGRPAGIILLVMCKSRNAWVKVPKSDVIPGPGVISLCIIEK